MLGDICRFFCFPTSLATGSLCRVELRRGQAMGGSFPCSSSEREGLPPVSTSLVWLIQWLVDLFASVESHDLISRQQSLLISPVVTTNRLVSLPRTELKWKQSYFRFLCHHVKMVAVIFSAIRKPVVNHTQSTLLPYQCSMHMHTRG